MTETQKQVKLATKLMLKKLSATKRNALLERFVFDAACNDLLTVETINEHEIAQSVWKVIED